MSEESPAPRTASESTPPAPARGPAFAILAGIVAAAINGVGLLIPLFHFLWVVIGPFVAGFVAGSMIKRRDAGLPFIAAAVQGLSIGMLVAGVGTAFVALSAGAAADPSSTLAEYQDYASYGIVAGAAGGLAVFCGIGGAVGAWFGAGASASR